FDSDPPKSTLQLMEREVGAVLAATGAQFSWLALKTDSHAETFDNLAVLRFRGSCRMERIGLPPAVDAHPVTLGETDLISGGVSVFSSVECDQIKTCISGLLATS